MYILDKLFYLVGGKLTYSRVPSSFKKMFFFPEGTKKNVFLCIHVEIMSSIILSHANVYATP